MRHRNATAGRALSVLVIVLSSLEAMLDDSDDSDDEQLGGRD